MAKNMTTKSLFSFEEDIIRESHEVLSKKDELIPREEYEKLLVRYERLFKQMQRILRISDRFQLELSLSNKDLEQLSTIDSLTKIPNRRHFNQTYEQEWRRAKREGNHLTVGMIDIDYFKKYNDTYGHIEGDNCIERVASTIQNSIQRPADYIARYGGEEFGLILPNTDIDGAVKLAEKIRSNVESLQMAHCLSDKGVVTVSIGISSEIPIQEEALMLELLNRADKALYKAKEEGRNRVEHRCS
ncbi:MAG: diguanylate cyclase [Desulfamplus sp.]|nr:diguanylate cyclase [Desulfamplus sp.]